MYDAILGREHFLNFFRGSLPYNPTTMRDDYLQSALKVITDPNILINVISTRVKQLRAGSRPLVTSLEKLAVEDIALREVLEGKITYELPSEAELLANPRRR